MTKSRTAHRLIPLSSATALYLGETAVDAMYLGAVLKYSSEEEPPPEGGDALLLESGDYLLLESGDKLLLEDF